MPIRLHWSFPLVVLFVVTPTGGRFTALSFFEGLGWVAALFVCVVIHELSHSFVARRRGFVVRDIVLLPIGGASEISGLPGAPADELAIASAGPLASIALALVFALFAYATGARPVAADAVRGRACEPAHVAQRAARRLQPAPRHPDGWRPGAARPAREKTRRPERNGPRGEDRPLGGFRHGDPRAPFRLVALPDRPVRRRRRRRRAARRRGAQRDGRAQGPRRDGARSGDARGELPAVGRGTVPASDPGPRVARGRNAGATSGSSRPPTFPVLRGPCSSATPPIASLPPLAPGDPLYPVATEVLLGARRRAAAVLEDGQVVGVLYAAHLEAALRRATSGLGASSTRR